MLAIAVASTGAFFALVHYERIIPSGQNNSTAVFTIVISRQGFNGSVSYSGAWPIMKVHKGQTVMIHLENTDPLEPHGFAIDHYFDSGIALRPGKTYDLTIVADQSGTFRVFCNIFCTIHVYMQNGELIVN